MCVPGFGQDPADRRVVVVQELRHEHRAEILRQREVEDASSGSLPACAGELGPGSRPRDLRFCSLAVSTDEQLVHSPFEDQPAAPLG
jgi:hypothetical protein